MLRRVPKINIPFQIRFIHGGMHLLAGNPSGSVEIWDYVNDKTIQVLSHDGEPMSWMSDLMLKITQVITQCALLR